MTDKDQCQHSSWKNVPGGKVACELCGAVGEERHYIKLDDPDLDLSDTFTRMFALAEHWMKRARAAEAIIGGRADYRNELPEMSAALAAAQERESRLARLAEGALRDHSADRHAAVVHALQVIQSALSQSSHEQARQSDVPAGYVQVPKEPTLDMYYAACKAYCAWEVQCAAEERAGREFSQPNFTHSDVYRAMIAAAPENATKQGIFMPIGE